MGMMMDLRRSWLTAAEIATAALPGLPSSKRNVNALADREGWISARNARGEALARPRQGRGGGMEYHVSLLPQAARAALEPVAAMSAPPTREDAWAAFERLGEAKKAEARRRLEILQAVEASSVNGGRTAAVLAIAAERDVSKASIYAWFKLVEGIDRSDRLPALTPRHQGGHLRVEIDEALFEIFKADYLRLAQPSWESCWRRTERLAQQQGVILAPLPVMKRRLLKDVPPAVQILLREGPDALNAAFPHQTRDRSMFHATQAMVSDTHTWDVMVDWPDGTQGRPAMVGISDLYSGKMLAWRVGRSETSEAVRLTFGDAFRTYGLPTDIWLDNGRAYASKQVTGGQANRYRFKVLPEDSQGMLTALGVKVHWTKPYSGQSKPIERSWRDFAGEIAKHPAFEGAYTGPNTVDKPANYGARTVSLDAFLDVVSVEIAAWNARTGRRSDVCAGRLSFDQAFDASYQAMAEAGGIRKATAEQLRLCMLSSQPVTCARDDGAVTILGNRYQSEALLAHCGKKVFIRFDPQDLHGEVYAYDLSHRFIAAAPCILKAGFADMDAGRKQARALGDFKRATKELAKAEVRHTAAQLAEMLAAASRDLPDVTPDEPKIVRPVFGALALQARALPAMTPETHEKPNRRDSLDRLAEHWAATRPDHLRVVTSE